MRIYDGTNKTKKVYIANVICGQRNQVFAKEKDKKKMFEYNGTCSRSCSKLLYSWNRRYSRCIFPTGDSFVLQLPLLWVVLGSLWAIFFAQPFIVYTHLFITAVIKSFGVRALYRQKIIQRWLFNKLISLSCQENCRLIRVQSCPVWFFLLNSFCCCCCCYRQVEQKQKTVNCNIV